MYNKIIIYNNTILSIDLINIYLIYIMYFNFSKYYNFVKKFIYNLTNAIKR